MWVSRNAAAWVLKDTLLGGGFFREVWLTEQDCSLLWSWKDNRVRLLYLKSTFVRSKFQRLSITTPTV